MDIRPGDRVAVNLAPFIGSVTKSQTTIDCRVVAVEGDHVEVRTEHPYRDVLLRVKSVWIEALRETEAGAAAG